MAKNTYKTFEIETNGSNKTIKFKPIVNNNKYCTKNDSSGTFF